MVKRNYIYSIGFFFYLNRLYLTNLPKQSVIQIILFKKNPLVLN